jgi:hypothetical protein
MKRIVNLKILLPATTAAAIAFILFACSSQVPSITDELTPGPNGQVNSSSSQTGDSGVSSSQPSGQGGSSSSVQGSNPGTTSSSSASEQGTGSSSSIASLSSSGTQNTSSSSRANSSSGTQNASSSSRANSSSGTQNASSSSVRSSSSGASVNPPPNGKEDYKETVGSASFDMVYIPGGTFTLGCESGTKCQTGAAKPVENVKMNSYFIMKAEATAALWRAVMGTSHAGGTWYEAIEFACELSKKTGKNYHLQTEAEFEYAAKKYKDKLSNIGGNGMTGEEWAYNSWDADKHMGGTDPVGPSSGQHTQKTRRDADSEGSDRVTSRLIRSIDGIGPATRLVVSADKAFPDGYIPSCDIHAPYLGGEPVNSYRDPRWITGDNAKWGTGSIAIGNFDLQVWEDGTAKLGSTAGQWFTSNNIAFVFVPNSGNPIKYPYIFLDENQGSVIGEGSMMSSGGYIGRFEKKAASGSKPNVTLASSAEALARAQPKFNTEYKMVDMENIPASAKGQDERLLDGGATKGWFQDNTSMQGAHHYRKDVDLDAFRFTVNQQGQRAAVLASGKWFTVNNTFLRVVYEKNGYTADYLYTVASDGTFYHDSFMGYERADFRMFKKVDNASMPRTNCGNICGEEIPKDIAPAAMYVNDKEKGQSTFTPAKCPSGGCN